MKSDQDYGQTKQQRLAFALLLAAIDHASNTVDNTLVKAERLPSSVSANWVKLEDELWRLEVTINAPRGENAAEKFWQYGLEVYKKRTGISEPDIDKPERISDLWKLLSKGDRPIAQDLRTPEEKGPGKWGHHFAFINLGSEDPQEDPQECVNMLRDWFNNQKTPLEVPVILVPNNIPESGLISGRFVGRKEQKTKLAQLLEKQGSRIAIVAAGGVGKTELTLQFLKQPEIRARYPGGICWVYARQIDSILQVKKEHVATEIVKFAENQLNIEIPQSKLTVQDRLYYCIGKWKIGRVLMVLDDLEQVSDYEKLKPYIPDDQRFDILITSRLNVDSPFTRFCLDLLSPNDSIALVEAFIGFDRINTERAEARKLVERLEYLPLALEIMSRRLANDPFLKIAKLLNLLDKSQKNNSFNTFAGLQKGGGVDGMTAKRGLVQALDLTWNTLSSKTKLVACLLGSYSDRSFAWETGVEKEIGYFNEELANTEKIDEQDLFSAKEELLFNNLIKPASQVQYQMHSLTREYFRCKLFER